MAASQPSARTPIPPLIFALFAAEVLLGVLHVLFTSLVPHPSLAGLFNLYQEGNVPTWFSSVQLALTGAVFGALARERERIAWPMVAAAVACFFLSLDEAAQIHEKIGVLSDALLPGGDRTNTVFHRSGIWMFILAPLLLGAFGWWWRSARPWLAGFPLRRRLLAGVLLFVIAATVPEILNNFTLARALRLALVLIEEIGEMASVTLVLWSAWALARHHGMDPSRR